MLVLPGQGILTIIIGLWLIDFPYKYKIEIWIIKHPMILRYIKGNSKIYLLAGRPFSFSPKGAVLSPIELR